MSGFLCRDKTLGDHTMRDVRHAGFCGPLTATAILAVGAGAPAWGAIDEIRVSARKREENLQDVPIAVEAFTIEEIERLNINSLDDITNRSASLVLDQGFSPQDTRITIRGLAPIQGRQNAAVLQDGIDISSQAIVTNGGSLLINPRLFDIERVEVVKGPQNALYGRSAFAGAINYVTRKPSEDLRITAGTDIGNNGQVEFRGGVSGPLLGNTLLGHRSHFGVEPRHLVQIEKGKYLEKAHRIGVGGVQPELIEAVR